MMITAEEFLSNEINCTYSEFGDVIYYKEDVIDALEKFLTFYQEETVKQKEK